MSTVDAVQTARTKLNNLRAQAIAGQQRRAETIADLESQGVACGDDPLAAVNHAMAENEAKKQALTTQLEAKKQELETLVTRLEGGVV